MKRSDSSTIMSALLLCVMALAIAGNLGAAEAQPGDVSREEIQDTIKAQSEKQQKEFDDIEARFLKAREVIKSGEYAQVEAQYKELIALVQTKTGQKAQRLLNTLQSALHDLRTIWSDGIIERATKLASDGSYLEAVAVVGEAQIVNSEAAGEVESLVEKWRNLETARDFTAASNISVWDDKFEAEKNKIRRLFYEATVYYNNGRYTEAAIALQNLLMLDNYNVRAMELLGRIYEQAHNSSSRLHMAQTANDLAMMVWEGIEPINLRDNENKITRSSERKTDDNSSAARMGRIVFQSIDFKDTPVVSVLQAINDLSKRSDPENKGVIISQTFAADDEAAQVLVTMQFSQIPMNELLRYLCLQCGFKYRVDKNGVVRIGKNVDEMQTRHFEVGNELVTKIISEDGEGGDAAAEGNAFDVVGGDEAGSGAAAANAASEQKLMAYFAKCGVPFEAGASIQYSKRANRMTVKNTVENLQRLDDILQQLELVLSEQPMVMTEVKFVEISDKDMEELGFDWTFGLANGKEVGDLKAGWSAGANMSNVRFGGEGVFETVASALVPGINLLPKIDSHKIFGADASLSLSIYALSENNRVEELSNPRIVTLNNEQATIRMVRKTKYPESWEAPDFTTSDGNVTISSPLPEFGDYKDTGIILQLQPEVGADNYTITLTLNPLVEEYLGHANSNYGVVLSSQSITGGGTITQNETYNMWMPEFSERSMEVTVQVYDGETIVLGGITKNRVLKQEDKFPLLGDIPIIGRLFTDRVEYAERTNLLIFVTARLVNSNGRPVRRSENNGIPNF